MTDNIAKRNIYEIAQHEPGPFVPGSLLVVRPAPGLAEPIEAYGILLNTDKLVLKTFKPETMAFLVASDPHESLVMIGEAQYVVDNIFLNLVSDV